MNKDEIQSIADAVVLELKSDFEEKVYQEAFLAELRIRGGYDYDRERVIPVCYKGQQVGFVKADVVVRAKSEEAKSEEIVLELKVSGEEDVKKKIRNELKAYLRAIAVSQPASEGFKRTGFVVMFPCTPNAKKAKTPSGGATVDEVGLEVDD